MPWNAGARCAECAPAHRKAINARQEYEATSAVLAESGIAQGARAGDRAGWRRVRPLRLTRRADRASPDLSGSAPPEDVRDAVSQMPWSRQWWSAGVGSERRPRRACQVTRRWRHAGRRRRSDDVKGSRTRQSARALGSYAGYSAAVSGVDDVRLGGFGGCRPDPRTTLARRHRSPGARLGRHA
jgi:hypothetical protein